MTAEPNLPTDPWLRRLLGDWKSLAWPVNVPNRLIGEQIRGQPALSTRLQHPFNPALPMHCSARPMLPNVNAQPRWVILDRRAL